ncbi:MAG: hypothetical protein AB1762_19725 [Gemmatimonadota bacterium]
MKANSEWLMAEAAKVTTPQKVEKWEITKPLLEAMFAEFKELGKKRPDATVSTAKIELINRLLSKCREVLSGEPSLEFLDLLDKDNVPQNSDVVLMLSQYVAAMSAFRAKYYTWTGVEHQWSVRDNAKR